MPFARLNLKGGFMKPILCFLTFIFLSTFIISCKTATKLYEKGNYDEAVQMAAKKLQKKPGDKELLTIIQSAYHYAVNDHEGRIHNYSESNNELKWEWMYYEYVSLQNMYDAIHKSPDVYDIVKPFDYSGYLVTYSEKAGDTRYNRGIAFMQRYDKKSYQDAYREFQAALRFIPGDRDAITKMNEAYEYAVINVIVLPMQQVGGFVYSSYTVGGNNLDDQMIRNLQNNSGNEFVKFYGAWDARSRNIRTDKVLAMQLTTLNVGHYQDIKSTRKASKEVLIKETVYKPDSVVKEYAKVYADITTTKRSMYSNARLQVTIRDENGSWLWTDNFPATHSWTTDFSTYKGDARALSDNDKTIINREPGIPPSQNEIVQCMLDEINHNALYRIRSYFSRL